MTVIYVSLIRSRTGRALDATTQAIVLIVDRQTTRQRYLRQLILFIERVTGGSGRISLGNQVAVAVVAIGSGRGTRELIEGLIGVRCAEVRRGAIAHSIVAVVLSRGFEVG